MINLSQKNRYHRLDAEELQDMLAKGRNKAEYQEWITAFCARKYNSDFSREMSRSVSEYLKQYT